MPSGCLQYGEKTVMGVNLEAGRIEAELIKYYCEVDAYF